MASNVGVLRCLKVSRCMKGSEFNGVTCSLPFPTAAKNGFCSIFAAYLLHFAFALALALRFSSRSESDIRGAVFPAGGEEWGF